jgi:hypothetical protein
MTTAFCTLLLWSQAAIGFTGHHQPKAGCCDVCGVETAEVSRLIQRLRCCPNWRARDDAAHDLREFDWKCHPEISEALVAAMLKDCDSDVREEAAESLAKMAPCVPGVHEALARTASCDPDWCTRKWAKRGLKALGKRCVSDCSVCGPIPGGFTAPPMFVEEPSLTVPGTVVEPRLDPSPGVIVEPPTDLPPPIPPSASPFVLPPTAARDRARERAVTPARKRPALTTFLPFGRRAREAADRRVREEEARRQRAEAEREERSVALKRAAADDRRVVGDSLGETAEVLHDRPR